MTVPVKKTPRIGDLLKDPEPVKDEADGDTVVKTTGKELDVEVMPNSATESQTEQAPNRADPQGDNPNESQLNNEALASVEMGSVSDSSAVESQSPTNLEKNENSTETIVGETDTETPVSSNELAVDEKFKEAWSTMFELLFREIATIYYPLKGVVPTIEHNIIKVKVKNESMKENFESRIRLALEYLRNNYDPRIDDIQVEVDAQTETVKVIYDTQDKMNDLRSENPDLPEFLKILNLSAKDM